MPKLSTLSPNDLQVNVILVIHDIVKDWELDPGLSINADTGLIGDLEFESIDIVRLVVALEQHFECKGLPFENLFMTEGGYISELKVHEIVSFLSDLSNK